MKLLEESVLGRDDGVPRLVARQFATFASFTEDGRSVVTGFLKTGTLGD